MKAFHGYGHDGSFGRVLILRAYMDAPNKPSPHAVLPIR